MKKNLTAQRKLSIWSIGGSVFAMFFGAGNVVFPLALGCRCHAHPIWASFGMILTAVCVPLLGLFAMLLYSGDYKSFFSSVGKGPGAFFIGLILCVIGPFGGIPRTIAVAHATLLSLSGGEANLVPSLPVFSLIFCVLIYLFVCKLSQLIQWLGSVFFPLMLVTLIWIIFKGLTIPAVPDTIVEETAAQAWLIGVVEGFNTMDLLGAFFFCSILLISIRQMVAHEHDGSEEMPLDFHKISKENKRKLILGFLLAAVFLSLVYLGFALCSARHSGSLIGVPRGHILGSISALALGKNSILTGFCVFIACLTTAIALVGILGDFLARILASRTVSYSNAIIITLVPTYLIANLNFENISAYLFPFLEFSYPALITLTCGAIAHKLWGFRYQKALFYLTFSLTVLLRLI